MSDAAIHTFHAVDIVSQPAPRLLFTGPWPISGKIIKRGNDFRDWHEALRQPWRIVHPKADPDVLYRVCGMETHCMPTLWEGNPVGLMVRLWEAG